MSFVAAPSAARAAQLTAAAAVIAPFVERRSGADRRRTPRPGADRRVGRLVLPPAPGGRR